MKKIMVITTLLLFAATTSFAGVSITIPTTMTKATTGQTVYGAATGTATNGSPMIGKTSSGVGVGMLVAATGTGYALVTQHLNGTKAYGSTWDGTAIYAKDVTTVGAPLLAVPGGLTIAVFAGYTAL